MDDIANTGVTDYIIDDIINNTSDDVVDNVIDDVNGHSVNTGVETSYALCIAV